MLNSLITKLRALIQCSLHCWQAIKKSLPHNPISMEKHQSTSMQSTTDTFAPFIVRTCESIVQKHSKSQELKPTGGNVFEPFEIYDPFGIRNAIVPIFRQTMDGRMYGMGTAFHVDGFGTYLTAYHVVDFIQALPASRPILFLSMHAVIFGTQPIPPDCFVPAQTVFAALAEVDDPMASLRGQITHVPAVDVAGLKTHQLGPGVRAPQSLPIRLGGWTPQLGEFVLAVGYPKLDLSELNTIEQSSLLTEGMYGAYGRIIALHPNGTSSTNPTPVFEVEGDWPGGMSGGPVFNRYGEVVGMVSRSLRAEFGIQGAGYAVHFGIVNGIDQFIPSVDKTNPGWRFGWGLISKDSEELISIHSFQESAEAASMSSSNKSTKILKIHNRIGTLEYVVL